MHSSILVAVAAAAVASAHSVITYPGWRGNNLITNDSFPYGMQWIYPCKSALTLRPARPPPPVRLRAAASLATPTYARRPLSDTRFLSPHRWRRQDHHEPDILAHDGRCCSLPARLVPGPCDGPDLRQPGLRHRRARQRAPKHEQSHDSPVRHHRALAEPLSRHHLPAPGAHARQRHHQRRRSSHHPDRRAGRTRRRSVLGMFCSLFLSPSSPWLSRALQEVLGLGRAG